VAAAFPFLEVSRGDRKQLSALENTVRYLPNCGGGFLRKEDKEGDHRAIPRRYIV
jgi:hypothetical protein